MTTSRTDKEKSTELKELPIVAKYEDYIVDHSWLNPTEILLEWHKQASKVWNIKTNSVTTVDKKPKLKEEKEFLMSDSTCIKEKHQMGENEFLIVARTTQYFSQENPDVVVDSKQAVAINRKNREEKKPKLHWVAKGYDSCGIYRKNKEGKYESILENVQPLKSQFIESPFKVAILSENHFAICNTETRKIDFWKREATDKSFLHDKVLDLSPHLPADEQNCVKSSLLVANPSTLIYTQLDKKGRGGELSSLDHQIILKIDSNSCEVVGKIEPVYERGVYFIRPDRLKKLVHPSKTLFYCDLGHQHDNWFYGRGVLFDVDEMAFYNLPLEMQYINSDDYCSVSSQGLLAVNNSEYARFFRQKDSLTIYKFPHSEPDSKIELALSEHLFVDLAKMVNEYLSVDLPKLYGKPFWSNQLKKPEIEEEKRVTKTLT